MQSPIMLVQTRLSEQLVESETVDIVIVEPPQINGIHKFKLCPPVMICIMFVTAPESVNYVWHVVRQEVHYTVSTLVRQSESESGN